MASIDDTGPLDRTACECLGAVNEVPQGGEGYRAAPWRAARTGHPEPELKEKDLLAREDSFRGRPLSDPSKASFSRNLTFTKFCQAVGYTLYWG